MKQGIAYQMVIEIFAIYMLAYIEKYDPAVIKREMSNKRVYLYDNGFATATQYSLAEDRGKRLENVVFRHLREKIGTIFFIRNKWECDFVVLGAGEAAELIQVTDRLNQNNLHRELKGLEAGKRYLGTTNCLLLVDTIQKGIEVPNWVKLKPYHECLYEQK